MCDNIRPSPGSFSDQMKMKSIYNIETVEISTTSEEKQLESLKN